jgi:hypothetical protein
MSKRSQRTIIAALEAEGLTVLRIEEGKRHTKLYLSNGRLVPMSRGTSLDTNIEKIARDQARRIARETARERG